MKRMTTHPQRLSRRLRAEKLLVARLEHLAGPGPYMRSMRPGDLLEPDEVELKLKVNLQHLHALRDKLPGKRVSNRED